MEAASGGTLNLEGNNAKSAISGSIIAQTGGSVAISGTLNLRGATLSGEGNFSNSGTIDLTTSNILSSITNTGTINLTSGTLSKAIISGSGTVQLGTNTSTNLTIDSDITQNQIVIQPNSTVTLNAGKKLTATKALTAGGGIKNNYILTANASDLMGEIENNHTLKLTGGSLGHNITTTTTNSTLVLLDDVVNVVNNYSIKTSTLTLTNSLSGNGSLYLTGSNDISSTNNTITQKDLTNTGTLVAKGNQLNITNGIINDGTLKIAGGNFSQNVTAATSGKDKLQFSGTSTNTASIAQSLIEFLGGSSVTTSASLLNGEINVALRGSLIFSEGTTSQKITNNGTITAAAGSAITGAITNNGTITAAADIITGAITNNSILNLNAGTFSAASLGGSTGTLNILGDVTNNSASNIQQKALNISSGATLTNNQNQNITTSTLSLNDSGKIEGTGSITLTGTNDIYLSANGTITQDNFTNANTGILTINGNQLKIKNGIKNNGTLQIKTGDFSQNVSGTADRNGTIQFLGTSTNTANIAQGFIRIMGESSVTTSASLLNGEIVIKPGGSLIFSDGTTPQTTFQKITNDGTLKLNEGALTNTASITQASGKGKVCILGDVTNNAAKFEQNSIEIASGMTFENNINSTVANLILNSGSAISGTGGLIISGTADISSATGTITQKGLTLTNSAILSAYNTQLSITDDIINTGTINLYQKEGENKNFLNGIKNNSSSLGSLNIKSGHIIAKKGIEQNNLTIEAGAELENNAGNSVLLKGAFANGGTLTNNGNFTINSSTSTGTIDGSGNLTITGTVTNSGTNSIRQANVIIGSGGTLNTAGDKITAKIENNNMLNLTSGDNSNAITGVGTTTFGKASTTVSMDNSASITQSLIKILGGATVINQVGSTLEATGSGIVIDRNGVLIIENAADIAANTNITDNGTLKIAGDSTASISGSGNIIISGPFTNKGSISTSVLQLLGDISGNGTLTLNADNDFTLTPLRTIEQSSIKIASGATTAYIDQLIVDSDKSIINNSTLNLKKDSSKEGSFTQSITGSGTLNIKNNIETTSSIEQGTLSVDSGITLTNSKTITLTQNNALQKNLGTIENNGTLSINNTTSNKGSISGEGIISIAVNKSLTTDANLLGANQTLKNLGTLILTGGSENSPLTFDIAGFSADSKTKTGGVIQFGDGTASSYILNKENIEQKQIVISNKANVENVDGISLTSLSQNITNAGTLTVKADDIKTNITNSLTGTVNLKGGVLNKTISANGTVNVNSDLVNKSTIETVNFGLNANIDGSGESSIIQLTGANNDLTSGSYVIRNNIIKNTGTLSVKANQINDASAVQNSGSLYITEGPLSIAIGKVGNAGGTTYFGSSKNDTKIELTNNAAITQAVIDVLSNTTLNNYGELKALTNIKVEGILNTKADLLASKTQNTGRINLSDGGTIGNNINGTGTLNIEDDVENTATISQNTLIVKSGETFTNTKIASKTDSGNITVAKTLSNSGTIVNNAKLTLQGGSTDKRNQTGLINGDAGELIITGHYNNDSSITQKNITISSNYSLATEVDKIKVADNDKITVNGALYLSAGKEGNSINNVIVGSGNGTTYINGDLELLTSNKSISSKITINGNKKLTALADNIKGNVTNAEGELILQGSNSEGGTLTKSVSGNGKTIINGNIVANNSIENLIEILEGKTLDINVAYLGNTVTTENNSILKLTGGTSIHSYVPINKSINGSGLTEIAGHLSIGDAAIATDILIDAGYSLTAGAAKIANKTITNEGTLILNGGKTTDFVPINLTNKNKNTSIGDLYINTPDQKIEFNSPIHQKSVTLGANSTIKTDANYILQDIQGAYGTVILTSGAETPSTLAHAISGSERTVEIEGNVINNSILSSKDLIIQEGAILTNNATLSSPITNKGTLNLLSSYTGNSITDTGVLNFGDGVKECSLINSATISQKEINVLANANVTNETGGTLTATNGINVSDGAKLTVENSSDILSAINNQGTVELKSNTLSRDITGEGISEINGDVKINSDNYIRQNILISNGTLTAHADSIKGNVVNNSILSITGGNVLKTITAASGASGIINISNDTTLSNTIGYQKINIQKGSLVLNTNDNFVNNTDSIEITGGILDMQNPSSKSLNSISLYDFIATNSTKNSGIKFDTDFSLDEGFDTDTINVSHSATGNLNLKSINLKSHLEGDVGITRTIKLFTGEGNLDGLSLGETSTELGQYLYVFKPGEKRGELIVEKLNGLSLAEVIQLTGNVANVADTYSIADSAYTLTKNMGTLTRKDSETPRVFTINGNDYGLIANGNQGITINSGDTLNLENIQGFKDFTGTAVTNSGNLNIDKVKFENNKLDIENNGTLTFENNASILSGGISGNGTTNFDVSMDVSGKNIAQRIINISQNAVLTANAGNLSASSYILNDGLLKLLSGTNSSVIKNSTDVEGAKLQIIGDVINNNDIEQNILISQGSLTSSADNIKGDIENNVADGLILTGGILNKTVSGSNNTNTVIDTTSAVELGESGSINQDITIRNGILKTTLSQISDNININNQGTLEITGSGTLNKNIEGLGRVDILGNINNNIDLKNVNIQNNGVLTTDASKLKGTVSNSGNINLSGILDKTITGSGKVNIKDTLNLTNGAAIDGTLNLADSTLDLQDNSYNNHIIGKLENNGNLKLDINTLNGGSFDSITLTNAADKGVTLTINDLAIKTNDDSFNLDLNILGGNTTNVSLKLSDELINQYNIAGEITQKQVSDELKANVTFNDVFNTKVYKVQTNTTMAIVDKKLQYSKTTTETFTGQETTGDTLALINQSKDFTAKTMTSTGSAQIYDLKTDLGLTKNTLTVTGVKDDSSTTSINMNQHKGFELKDDDSVLNLQNLAFTNAKNQNGGLIDIQNSNARVNFNNVEIAESSANLINNDGTITLSGNNAINTNVTGIGSVTVQNGTTSVNNIIQGSINIQTGANLEITGGVIESNIQGLGNTLINTDTVVKSDVQSNILVNNNKTLKIAQGANVAAATKINLSEGSTLDIQGTAPTALNNINVAAGKSANIKMDWGDIIGTKNILGNLAVSSIDLTSTTGDDTYKFATGANLGNISFEGADIISNATSANSIRYSSSTGNLTSIVNNLIKAVADNQTGDYAIYSMSADEEAGNSAIGIMEGGKLVIQGNSNTITNYGIQVGDGKNSADLTLKDTNFEVTGIALEVKDNSMVTIQAENSDITINGDIVSSSAANTVTFKGTKTINFNGKFDPAEAVVGGATVNRGGDDDGIDWTVTSGSLNYLQDSYLNRTTNTVNMNGGTLNTINGAVTDFVLGKFTLSADSNFYADVDLANGEMDNFQNTPVAYTGGTLHVAGLNLISDAIDTNTSVSFTPASWVGQGYVDYAGSNQLTALAPIYKYNVNYDDSTGNFDFARFASGGYGDFNPIVLAAPVAAQLGGYFTQLNSYDQAFRNMDMYMLMTKKERLAMKLRNKYASADGNLIFDPTVNQYENPEGWFRPYATFENVGLKNGPKVDNIAYGTFMGGESQMYDLGRGWDGMWGVYVGYNGSHQNYDGVSIYQNGGTLGVIGMAYKGNFFQGLTVNAGASAARASGMYGSEDFAMLMTGVASKTGYNFELSDSKFILQPNLMMSYSMVNTFDYHNAAGVAIDSKPLNAMQIEPGIKFIGNLKDGWQPYAGVSVVWNVIDKTKFTANDVSLPDLSVKPYVRYGVGVRKSWGERFTGFLQAFVTNGGRNGVGLQAGFCWALGKKGKPIEKKALTLPERKPTEIILNGKKIQ